MRIQYPTLAETILPPTPWVDGYQPMALSAPVVVGLFGASVVEPILPPGIPPYFDLTTMPGPQVNMALLNFVGAETLEPITPTPTKKRNADIIPGYQSRIIGET